MPCLVEERYQKSGGATEPDMGSLNIQSVNYERGCNLLFHKLYLQKTSNDVNRIFSHKQNINVTGEDLKYEEKIMNSILGTLLLLEVRDVESRHSY